MYEGLKEQVWEIIKVNPPANNPSTWHHFGGTAMLCAFLGLKRDLNVEICKCAGFLHDVWLFSHFPLDVELHKKHGYLGSDFAGKLLRENGGYTAEQIEIICRMIYHHNDKDAIHDVYSETLKDADALDHYLNNSGYDKAYNDHGRNRKVLDEFMMGERV